MPIDKTIICKDVLTCHCAALIGKATECTCIQLFAKKAEIFGNKEMIIIL